MIITCHHIELSYEFRLSSHKYHLSPRRYCLSMNRYVICIFKVYVIPVTFLLGFVNLKSIYLCCLIGRAQQTWIFTDLIPGCILLLPVQLVFNTVELHHIDQCLTRGYKWLLQFSIPTRDVSIIGSAIILAANMLFFAISVISTACTESQYKY